ncbi:MAG TPA: PadR family transcriptional regulator [Acidimicrobiales bacterium]|nr:PadR family transcriptional regulator [Acidimicrobiales bacterium]
MPRTALSSTARGLFATFGGYSPAGSESVRRTIARSKTNNCDISNRCIVYAVRVLEFTILGLLKERPMHGYDLRKRMREEFGTLENLSFGSLYPALARLEAGGDIRPVAAVEPVESVVPVPFTGSLSGERAATVTRRATAAAAAAFSGRDTRKRKVYEITPGGEVLFDRLFDSAEEKDDHRSFSLRLAFARYLSPAARFRLLERHQIDLSRRLTRANDALAVPVQPLDFYRRSIAEHARDGIIADLAWITSMLEQERAASIAEAPSGPPEAGQVGILESASAVTHDGGIA